MLTNAILDRNTTLAHPEADTSENACITASDTSVNHSRANLAHSFLHGKLDIILEFEKEMGKLKGSPSKH